MNAYVARPRFEPATLRGLLLCGARQKGTALAATADRLVTPT